MTTQPGQLDLVVNQGATWYLPLAVYTSDGLGGEALMDTTGYTGRFTIRDGGFGGAAVITATTGGGGVVVGYSPAARAASTAYALGALVTPSTLNGYVYEATTAGTTGSGSVLWPVSAGATVTDGTLTWTARAQDERVTNVYVLLTAAQTAALTDWGWGVYTLEVVDTFGNVMRLLEGTARLSREASY